MLGHLRLHHHALSGVLFEYPDYLEMERWADPHSVGIDQFFADICTGSLSTTNGVNRVNLRIRRVKFCNQCPCRFVRKELSWLLVWCCTRCLMNVIQAVAAFGVFTDGDGVKVEKKAPRINYVGFIAPLMTLVSSWIHA